MIKKILLASSALLVILLVTGLFLKNTDIVNFLDLDSDSEISESTKTIDSANTEAKSNQNFTLTDVKTHNNRSDCWSIINSKVYNLTDWIDKHPGGENRIISICGIDGSNEFNSQHSNQQEPESYLSSFYVGDFIQN